MLVLPSPKPHRPFSTTSVIAQPFGLSFAAEDILDDHGGREGGGDVLKILKLLPSHTIVSSRITTLY